MRTEQEILATFSRLRTLIRNHGKLSRDVEATDNRILARITRNDMLIAYAADQMRIKSLMQDQHIQLRTAQVALAYALGRSEAFIDDALEHWEKWLADATESRDAAEADTMTALDAYEEHQKLHDNSPSFADPEPETDDTDKPETPPPPTPDYE